MILIHNPRCGKSREALQLLKDKGIEPEIREYLKDTLSAEEIKELISMLNLKAEETIRKNEAIYKENFKGTPMTQSKWIKALVKYPKLLQRPILIHDKKAIIARPPELILDFV